MDLNFTPTTHASPTERLTSQHISSIPCGRPEVKSSHIDFKDNDHCLSWLNHKYGEHGQVKATRGTSHDYLGMTFDYTEVA
jgi:hypothetical protein